MDSPSVWTSIQNEPLLPPPHGVTPNLEHPESRADDIFITAGICLALILLSACSAALRKGDCSQKVDLG